VDYSSTSQLTIRHNRSVIQKQANPYKRPPASARLIPQSAPWQTTEWEQRKHHPNTNCSPSHETNWCWPTTSRSAELVCTLLSTTLALWEPSRAFPNIVNLRWYTLVLFAFPLNNFKHFLTLFSKFFSSFPHGTCSLSVSCPYLALDEIYHPLSAAFPNNATRRKRIVECQSQVTDGTLTLYDVLFQKT